MSSNTNTTAMRNYSGLVLETNFGTRQAEKIFQHLLEMDKKYDSEVVCRSIDRLVAETITDIFGEIIDFSDRYDPDFETMISMLRSSLLQLRSEISEQLVGYYTLHRKNQPLDERDMVTEQNIILINPIKSHKISDSVHKSIFNWNLQPQTSRKTPDRKRLIKKIESDYDLMYQLCFEGDGSNNCANWDDLLSGYARYILYNHSKYHSINITDTNQIASVFSNIFKDYLEEEFSKQQIYEKSRFI